MKTIINKKWTLNLPKERYAFFELNPYWEKERLEAMYHTIRKGDVVLDIGSEHGDMSALFCKWSQTPMILIEAAYKYYYWTKMIFEMNDLPTPKTIVGLASDETRNKPDVNNGWPQVADEEQIIEPGFVHLDENKGFMVETVPQIRLDDIKFDKLDVITMDTEGSEFNIIFGAENTLLKHRPQIFMSIHDKFLWDRYGQTVDDLIIHMQKLNYEPNYLATDHEQHWHFKPL
jgi:FkbM family methyltransferase